eukprot:TRINITY_DN12553_c0_g6_i1.p1 TRINITY_DN12553_c0_g6~~TRINITY_DN12553_c0_g6_i1.p1  ORF type:complete len:541 (+),score=224.93 TRINITY_DN12553_c0_g6_i1:156-1778(+)
MDNEEWGCHEGILQKLGGGVIKRHQERWFELRKGVLHYYSAKPLGKVDLAGAAIDSQGSHSWTISGPGMRHSYTLKGSNEGEKAVWMARLQQSITSRNNERKRSMSDGLMPSGFSNPSESCSTSLDHTATSFMQSGHNTVTDSPPLHPQRHTPSASPSRPSSAVETELANLRARVEELSAQNTRLQEQIDNAPPPSCTQCAHCTVERKRQQTNGVHNSEASGETVLNNGSANSSEGFFSGMRSGDDSIELKPDILEDDHATLDQLRSYIAEQREDQKLRKEEMSRQLGFEREEQRTLRADLCQEIDRLREELRATYIRMSSAEEQSEELLTRAIAASQFTTSMSNEAGSTPPLEREKLRKAMHLRSRSADFDGLPDGFQRDTQGLVTHAPEGQLQVKLEQKMVQKYIELKKVLHDLQDVGIERVEHVVVIKKYAEDEKLGVCFKKPNNIVKSVAPKLPAARCGIKPGMIIVAVDGMATPTHDKVLSALVEYKKTFEVIVSEPLTELTARVEGNTLLAEEREAILLENDCLRKQLQAAGLR